MSEIIHTHFFGFFIFSSYNFFSNEDYKLVIEFSRNLKIKFCGKLNVV